MRTSTKAIAALAVVALVGGVGFAAAQDASEANARPDRHRGPGDHPGIGAVFRLCDDNITVGDCKEIVREHFAEKQQERRDARYERCVEEHGQERCDEWKANHDGRPARPESAPAPDDTPEDTA